VVRRTSSATHVGWRFPRIALALLLLFVTQTHQAHADERATAEELFVRGRQAMDRREFPRACDLLDASLKLEDTLGTLLNVALCHEAIGRVATAWGEFRAAEQRALRSIPVQTGRVELARQHAEALQPKLSRLRITLDPKIDARVVEIRIDGKLLATEALTEGTPVDPGKRALRASAPQKLPVELSVDVPPGPSTTAVAIPALANAPTPIASASASDVEAVAAARGRRAAGYVAGGVGLAFVAAGAVLGVLALDARGEAACEETEEQGVRGCFTTRRRDGRVEPNPELDRAQKAFERGTVFANLSTGGFLLGAVGLGVGLYLVLTAKVPESTGPARTARLGRPSPRPWAFGFEATF
jgi:hypothetical protein